MNKKYIVRLSSEEREQLLSLVKKGKIAARKQLRARILLHADQSELGPAACDEEIAGSLETSVRTVERLRQRLVEEGLPAALEDKRLDTPPRPPKLDGRQEAQLVALCCSQPPKGRARWTLRLLGSRLVELEVVDCISHETVRQVLKKTSLSLG
jgi:transposase